MEGGEGKKRGVEQKKEGGRQFEQKKERERIEGRKYERIAGWVGKHPEGRKGGSKGGRKSAGGLHLRVAHEQRF